MIIRDDVQVVITAKDNFSHVAYIPKGLTLNQILQQTKIAQKKDIIAARVNNIYCDLNKAIIDNSDINFISVKEDKGLEIYRHTAVHILSYVIYKIFGRNVLNIGPSIQYNYYFDLEDGQKLNAGVLNRIKNEFHDCIKQNYPIEPEILSAADAIRYYRTVEDKQKIQLIEFLKSNSIKFYKINDFKEMCSGPLGPETGLINKIDFLPYPPGFLVEFPQIEDNSLKMIHLKNPKKLSKIFLETRDWYKTQGVSNVMQLNDLIEQNKLTEIITISEAFHEKRISQIADMITGKRKDVKLVLIAGPSSSGKTTFAKRLSVQLKVNGVNPIALSLDDYFVNREQTPVDDKGNYNFECLEALDLKLLNQHLNDLMNGNEIHAPLFDFHTGHRKQESVPIKLEKDQIIIIEGIHGLNDQLTFSIPKEKKFKIYVSALSQLRLNNIHRISTTDTRLFRRIIRDYLFRNHSAQETLKMWPNVRRGEELYIFPFQENADIIFNSALIYESAIVKTIAQKYLLSVTHNMPEYSEAKRLLDILDHFMEMHYKHVPKVSIIREFIGGSSFKY